MSEAEPEVAGGALARVVAARDFLVDTRSEMDKVSWPPRAELTKATRAVVIGALVLGLVIGIVDTVLQKLLIDGLAVLTR